MSESTVPVPPTARSMPRSGRVRRWVAGVLALLVLGGALFFEVSLLRAQHALDTAPICAAGAVTRECRQLVRLTVTDVRVTHGRNLDVTLSTHEAGAIGLLDSRAAAAENIRAGDSLIGQRWHGRVVRVDGDGVTADTLAMPSNTALGWLILVVVAAIVAHLTLRSITRQRLWDRLGRRPQLAAETRLVGAIGLVLLVVLTTGVVLLIPYPVAGAAVVLAYVALLIYGLFVPYYPRRLIIRAVGSEERFAPLPRQMPRRVAGPVSGDPDH
jgi:hypothetical protein